MINGKPPFQMTSFFFQPGSLTPSCQTVKKHAQRIYRLYEQGALVTNRILQYVRRWTVWLHAGLASGYMPAGTKQSVRPKPHDRISSRCFPHILYGRPADARRGARGLAVTRTVWVTSAPLLRTIIHQSQQCPLIRFFSQRLL